MQFSKTSSIASPIATTPTTVSLPETPIDTTVPADIVTKGIEDNSETTVMAMGYATVNDVIEEDIDLSELLDTSDSNVFINNSASQQEVSY